MLKIDIFAHILGPKYLGELDARGIRHHPGPGQPLLTDIEGRVEYMSQYQGLTSVISPLGPPLEVLVTPRGASELSRICNDEIAEAVAKYPDYFIAAVASVPLGDMDLCLAEAQRAIETLGFKGVQVSSNVGGTEDLTSERLFPLYGLMEHYDLPIWIHPWFSACEHWTTARWSDWTIGSTLGWPLDTTAAMMKLAYSDVFDRFPNLKFITHHAGAYMPVIHPRIAAQKMSKAPDGTPLPKEEQEKKTARLKNFYCDTALYSDCTLALEHAAKYFGVDRMMFGTDFPSMPPEELGYNIESVQRMNLSPEEKEQIFFRNAVQLLRL